MANKNRYSVAQVVEALTAAKGFVSVAARSLGCSDGTVRNYIARYEACAAAQQDARERMIDLAEAKLYQLVQEGNVAAVIFTLKTVGKNRGYIEPGVQLRMENELRNGNGDSVVTTVTLSDWKKLADERMRQADEAVALLDEPSDAEGLA